jgi:hypothetical protein
VDMERWALMGWDPRLRSSKGARCVLARYACPWANRTSFK